MNKNEMEQTIRFILSEQAKVTTGLEQVTENTAQLQRMMLSMTELFNRERKDLREKLAALTDAQIRAEVEMKEIRLENQQFRADVGQAMTMLENSQDKVSAAIVELHQGQRELRQAMAAMAESSQRRDDAMAEMAQAVASAHRRLDKVESDGKQS